MEAENLLGIENVVVIPADTRQIFHLRKGFRKNLVLTVTSIFPAVFWSEQQLFFKAGRTAHHHKVRDVVSDDKGFGLILEMNFPAPRCP